MIESKMWIEDFGNSRALYFLDHEGKKRIVLTYDGVWDESFVPISICTKE